MIIWKNELLHEYFHLTYYINASGETLRSVSSLHVLANQYTVYRVNVNYRRKNNNVSIRDVVYYNLTKFEVYITCSNTLLVLSVEVTAIHTDNSVLGCNNLATTEVSVTSSNRIYFAKRTLDTVSIECLR